MIDGNSPWSRNSHASKAVRTLILAPLWALLLGALAMFTGCHDRAAAPGTLRVDEAYFRLPVAGRDVSTAYLQLHNSSDLPQTLAGFASPEVRAIELHQNLQRDGVMQMRRVEGFVLGVGESLSMQPGGYHLMLFGLSLQLGDDAKITIELLLASGDNVSVVVPARAVR